ncbi:MAG: molybdenum cofactor sulfurase [Planctomycetota bacterium]|nr:MAG: molybdenum cofactor sulfurase [Planctomycetota bacterium]
MTTVSGELSWIGLRPAPRADVQSVSEAQVVVGQGLQGDRFEGRPGGAGTRQVTLVAQEDLARAGELLERAEPLDPADLRRNLMLTGVDLSALREQRVRIGNDVLLEITGGCPPCGRMEETVGEGGRDALAGLAGLTARVLHGGVLRVGDQVTLDTVDDATARA